MLIDPLYEPSWEPLKFKGSPPGALNPYLGPFDHQKSDSCQNHNRKPSGLPSRALGVRGMGFRVQGLELLL